MPVFLIARLVFCYIKIILSSLCLGGLRQRTGKADKARLLSATDKLIEALESAHEGTFFFSSPKTI